jgi:hypothetical protein
VRGDFGRGDTVFWRPPCMNPGERQLCHVWVKLQTCPYQDLLKSSRHVLHVRDRQ